MGKKITYLFLALLLPVLIFVFLKYFGKNKFDIPVYYNEGISDLSPECPTYSKSQYYVPDSILRAWGWEEGLSIIVMQTNKKEEQELKRLIAEAGFKQLQTVSMTDNTPQQLIRLQNCVLFMKEPWNAVLIDKEKRIRGYYKLGSREETDRLEVELKILLNNY